MTATPAPASPASAPDWDAVRQETIAHAQALIRTDTSNPPGNEILTACYLEGVLAGAGIACTVVEPEPGRASVVARLAGDGSRRPVLLLAHMDVVGVVRESWTADPFGGEIRGEHLYGRGAIDDKGMLATNLMALLLLKRHVVDAGQPLARDVVFVATADEETGSQWGMRWLAEHHPELLDAEYALNEGGRIRIVNGRPLYAAIQCAEKVPHTVVLRAHGQGGHASIPLAENPVWRLARALNALALHREPVCLIPTTRRFFSTIAAVWPDAEIGSAMADVCADDPAIAQHGAEVLARVPLFGAVLRNGVSPTILAGGTRGNVIPTEVEARLNVRTLPGESIHDVAARLRETVGDERVDVLVTDAGEDAPASDVDSPMFLALADALRVLDPTLVVAPYLSTGATDNSVLRRLGVQAYGLLPFPLDADDEERMHGHDERVPLDALGFGARLTYEAMRRVALA